MSKNWSLLATAAIKESGRLWATNGYVKFKLVHHQEYTARRVLPDQSRRKSLKLAF